MMRLERLLGLFIRDDALRSAWGWGTYLRPMSSSTASTATTLAYEEVLAHPKVCRPHVGSVRGGHAVGGHGHQAKVYGYA